MRLVLLLLLTAGCSACGGSHGPTPAQASDLRTAVAEACSEMTAEKIRLGCDADAGLTEDCAALLELQVSVGCVDPRDVPVPGAE